MVLKRQNQIPAVRNSHGDLLSESGSGAAAGPGWHGIFAGLVMTSGPRQKERKRVEGRGRVESPRCGARCGAGCSVSRVASGKCEEWSGVGMALVRSKTEAAHSLPPKP